MTCRSVDHCLTEVYATLGQPLPYGMLMPIIIPSMTGDLELAPGSLPVLGDDRVWRLVAAWLLGYESKATRRNYALDLSGWLGFCESHQVDPLRARRTHVDA